MNIPKIAFSFWEGKQFTYLHYLTFFTFSKFNPDYDIIIYQTQAEDSPLVRWNTMEQNTILSNTYDIYRLKELPRVQFVEVDIKKEIGYEGPLSSVWKSDIIRILKLYEHGGIYIDFDTLFIGSIPESLLTIHQTIGFNMYNQCINNAFMIAQPKSTIAECILNEIRGRLHSRQVTEEYQQFGPALITRLIMNTPLQQQVYFIPNQMTCPYIWNQMDILFHTTIPHHTHETFCIHWYNGGPISRAYCASFSMEQVHSEHNNFEWLLCKALQ